MQFSSADKALYVKIVYYGPGLSGKTTNLETIHRLTDPKRRQPMVSLKTDGDRTLFFDLLPFDFGRMNGLNVRVKLFTVPGQIQYDTTRKQVLAGADGVVFVADSSPDRKDANVRMLRYLRSNLQANGLDPDTIPLVFQWNKRDLPRTLEIREMGEALNWRGVPALEAVATTGAGVIETFREITVATLGAVTETAARIGQKIDPNALRDRVVRQLDPFIPKGKPKGQTADPLTIGTVHDQEDVLRSTGDGRHRDVLGLDALLQEAVQANLQITEKLAAGPDPNIVYAVARRERRALARLVQIAAVSDDREALLRMALSAALSGTELTIGSLLIEGAPGSPLKETAVAGRERDPLNSIAVQGIGSAASGLLDRAGPYLCHDIPGELLFGQFHDSVDGLRSVLAVPFGRDARLRALLMLYTETHDRELTDDDAAFATLVTAVAALSLRSVLVGA